MRSPGFFSAWSQRIGESGVESERRYQNAIILKFPHAYFEKAHDVSHIVLKAQINHAVGFVHTQILAALQGKAAFLQHVNEATRSRNNDVKTLVERMRLF